MMPVRAQLDQLARIARAVLDCPDVVALHAGPTGRISSATATGRVVGLLFQGQCLVVGVIAERDVTNAEVTANVRRAVRPLLPRPMAVTVIVSAPRPSTAGV
jgi:hypothetical protein